MYEEYELPSAGDEECDLSRAVLAAHNPYTGMAMGMTAYAGPLGRPRGSTHSLMALVLLHVADPGRNPESHGKVKVGVSSGNRASTIGRNGERRSGGKRRSGCESPLVSSVQYLPVWT